MMCTSMEIFSLHSMSMFVFFFCSRDNWMWQFLVISWHNYFLQFFNFYIRYAIVLHGNVFSVLFFNCKYKNTNILPYLYHLLLTWNFFFWNSSLSFAIIKCIFGYRKYSTMAIIACACFTVHSTKLLFADWWCQPYKMSPFLSVYTIYSIILNILDFKEPSSSNFIRTIIRTN